MPTPWSLRRRPKGPAADDDVDEMQEVIARRLQGLLGTSPGGSAPEDPAGDGARGGEASEAAVEDPAPGGRPPSSGTTDDTKAARASWDPSRPERRSGRTDRRSGPADRRASAGSQAAACPYCAALLTPAPVTSRRCPRCRERIAVRHDAGRVLLFTEAAVPVFEAERRRAAGHGRYVGARDRWLRLAEAAGASPAAVRRVGDGIATEASVTAARALYTGACDRAFRAARHDRRWDRAERLRREEATAVHRLAGRPIPPLDDALALYREGVATRLRGLSELVRDVQMASATCCATCGDDGGRVASIAAELRQPTLPHAGCPAGLCRCRWTIAERDRAEARRRRRRLTRGSADPAE